MKSIKRTIKASWMVVLQAGGPRTKDLKSLLVWCYLPNFILFLHPFSGRKKHKTLEISPGAFKNWRALLFFIIIFHWIFQLEFFTFWLFHDKLILIKHQKTAACHFICGSFLVAGIHCTISHFQRYSEAKRFILHFPLSLSDSSTARPPWFPQFPVPL